MLEAAWLKDSMRSSSLRVRMPSPRPAIAPIPSTEKPRQSTALGPHGEQKAACLCRDEKSTTPSRHCRRASARTRFNAGVRSPARWQSLATSQPCVPRQLRASCANGKVHLQAHGREQGRHARDHAGALEEPEDVGADLTVAWNNSSSVQSRSACCCSCSSSDGAPTR